MPGKLFYLWRVVATGCCFVLFGLGGLVLRCVLLPIVTMLVPAQQRIAATRRMIRMSFRLFIAIMQRLGVLRYEIIGRERLARRGLLILANHPTLIDTVFLMAFVEHADCIVKAGLRQNIFTRAAVISAGYAFNNDGAGLMKDCIDSLHHQSNLIIFPEGTRTEPDGSLHFKRGAANVAVRAGCDITPVIIRCHPQTLGKGVAWWKIPAQVATFRIEVLEDIPITSFTADGVSDGLAARHLTTYLENYFTQGSQRHA